MGQPPFGPIFGFLCVFWRLAKWRRASRNGKENLQLALDTSDSKRIVWLAQALGLEEVRSGARVLENTTDGPSGSARLLS